MIKEVSNWFKQAKSDLEKAESNLKNNHLDGAAFFAQQCAEKALKALIIKTKGSFPKIHDVVALARLANAPETIVDNCKIITPYYTETRYPDMGEKIPAESFSKKEIEEVIKQSREVLKWVKKSLI